MRVFFFLWLSSTWVLLHLRTCSGFAAVLVFQHIHERHLVLSSFVVAVVTVVVVVGRLCCWKGALCSARLPIGFLWRPIGPHDICFLEVFRGISGAPVRILAARGQQLLPD